MNDVTPAEQGSILNEKSMKKDTILNLVERYLIGGTSGSRKGRRDWFRYVTYPGSQMTPKHSTFHGKLSLFSVGWLPLAQDFKLFTVFSPAWSSHSHAQFIVRVSKSKKDMEEVKYTAHHLCGKLGPSPS